MSKKINCPYLVIDNFYSDPNKIREFVLKQEFKIRGNYPGQRTLSFDSENINIIPEKKQYIFYHTYQLVF